MKNLSGPTTTAVGNPLGEDPTFVLKVEWATGIKWYADRDLNLNQAEGRIILAGNITAQAKQDGIGAVSAVSFVLDDGDGALKALIDTNCAEGTAITVYQSFASAPGLNDLILMLKGVIVQPEWSEGERTLKFEVETKVHDVETGFAIEQNFYEDQVVTTPLLNQDAVGQAWPLCFGSVVHVPAVKLFAPPETQINGTFKKGDTSFPVEDASKFPTDSPIDVVIDGMVFTVTVDKANNLMHVGEANVPKYHNVPFASRDATDPDYANPWVAWIGQDVSIANTFVYLTSEFNNTVYHRVIRQEGRKIWFDNKLVKKRNGSNQFNTGFGVIPALYGPPSSIIEVARYGRDGWGIQMSYMGSSTVGDARLSISSFKDTVSIISGVTWKFAAGETVKLWAHPSGSGLHPVRYVANLIPSASIRGVFAWRTNPKTGQRLFKAIPSSYYVVRLSDSLFGKTPTTIELKTPLSELYGQGWEEAIYVSLKSSVGPNAVDVIQWLLQTYSDLGIDTASFAAVKAKLTNYPVGFARFQKESVLQLAESIAWQERCAMVIENGVARLKYLSEEPTEDLTIDQGGIESRTINLDSTLVEDVVTHFRANWRKDYSGKPGRERTLVLTENLTRFGLRKREFDFFAFNVQSLVQKSSAFWAHRMANIWRLAKMNFLKRIALALEMFDTVKVNLADASMFGGSFKCVLDAHSYDPGGAETTFGFRLWMPCLAGTTIQDPRAWMSDAGDTLPADPADRINETVIDEQWADPLSNFYGTNFSHGHPAKIVGTVKAMTPDLAQQFPGAFYVDIFDDGYVDEDGHDLPPTNINALTGLREPLIAFPTDVSMALDRTFPADSAFAGLVIPGVQLEVGTKVSIFTVTGNRWMFNIPADKAHVVAKVADPSLDALDRATYDWYANGLSSPPTATGVPAKPVDPSNPGKAGDVVTVQHRNDGQTAIPVGSGVPVFPARLTTRVGHVYGFVQLLPDGSGDQPGGFAGLSTATEVTGSTEIDSGEKVMIFQFPGPTFVFWYPLTACPPT